MRNSDPWFQVSAGPVPVRLQGRGRRHLGVPELGIGTRQEVEEDSEGGGHLRGAPVPQVAPGPHPEDLS